ncbi:MAG: hypothetical protein AAFX94_02285 [Myxococcota bacterium]
MSVILATVLVAGCGVSDYGALAGVHFTDKVAATGLETTPVLGARAGADLAGCLDFPGRLEVHGRVEPGLAETSGDVSVNDLTFAVPVLLGVRWPARSEDNGIELFALVGPELRYEIVSTRILDDTSRDGFFRIAFLAQPGIGYRLGTLRFALLGTVRLEDAMDLGSILAVDFVL